ncbi:MAG: cell wall hydrolase [Clostridiales bacterium]|nr:cell wall hydrolase [Candidatus Apopatousia equi]
METKNIEVKNEKNESNKVENKKQKQGKINFKDFRLNKSGFPILIMVLVVSLVSILSVYFAGGFYSQVELEASSNMLRITQAKLSNLNYYDGVINGVMNTGTKQAIMDFQKDRGLKQTGSLNEATTVALGVSTDEQTNGELYLLAKLIYSEARGEIYTGQVAVGAVVLNRVDDAGFPNTLEGVIYQPWAFTALHDGQFGMEPNSTAYQAAQDAMNGWDPSYGSLYYYNPTTATSSWIFTRTTVVVIGNHVFAI